jgi:hypothetical protein
MFEKFLFILQKPITCLPVRSGGHLNPCDERWRLAEKPADYHHSFAAFYQFGKQGKARIKDYQDFLWLLQAEEEEGKKQ